jgi:hypothetical protein
MGLFEGDYPTSEARQQFFARAVRSLRTNPAFEGAAMSDRFRMTFANFGQFEVDGQTYVTDRDRPRGNSEAVSDGYFSTLGLKVLEGRDFALDDTDAKQPVAIVNASFAKRWFGKESPIGRRVRTFNPAQPQPWRTIVGVVPDTLMQGPFNQQTDSAGFYVPLLGVPPAPQFVTIVVRPHQGSAPRLSLRRSEPRSANSMPTCRSTSAAHRLDCTTKFSESIASPRRFSQSSG